MFYKRLGFSTFMVIASFGLHAKGPINVGLEAGKYPVNYLFSKEFEKKQ
jgi:hypothetical protein